MKDQPKIVVIGGGTGNFTLLKGLKKYTSNITAVVAMSDDGGSTGVLRDELGVLPPGDVRQCLVALSETDRIRDLFTYRFSEGTLDGHSFGNLFISAVEKMTDSFEQAIDVAGDVLRINGEVLPITLDNAELVAITSSGREVVGQHRIGADKLLDRSSKFKFSGPVTANKKAIKAIRSADVVVIAPGNMYGTLAPALIVDGVGEALKKTKAKVVQVTNLVTKIKDEEDYSVAENVREVEGFCGVGNVLDYVIFNTDEPTKRLRDKYLRDDEYTIGFDLDEMDSQHYKSIGLPLIDKGEVVQSPNDPIAHVRSLIRHDSDAVARQVMRIFFS